jgi:hypothetical protein
MPTRTVYAKPAVFLKRRGVTVYHVYKDDDLDNPPRDNIYTTDPVEGGEGDDDTKRTFDVRELSTWARPPHPPFLTGEDDTPKNSRAWERHHTDRVEERAMRKAIRDAMDKGEIGKAKEGRG